MACSGKDLIVGYRAPAPPSPSGGSPPPGQSQTGPGDYHRAAGWDSGIKILIISKICRLLEQDEQRGLKNNLSERMHVTGAWAKSADPADLHPTYVLRFVV